MPDVDSKRFIASIRDPGPPPPYRPDLDPRQYYEEPYDGGDFPLKATPAGVEWFFGLMAVGNVLGCGLLLFILVAGWAFSIPIWISQGPVQAALGIGIGALVLAIAAFPRIVRLVDRRRGNSN